MRDWDGCWMKDETPWDRGAAAPPLLQLLEGPHGSFLKDATVLVPGCGSGHDVRALVAHGAEPVGLDLSPKAVAVARSKSEGGAERYEVGDFLDGSREGYDALWEHTCYCAIDPGQRDAYAMAAARAVRPGGLLCGVFYLNPDNDGDGPPYGAETGEIRERFAGHFTILQAGVPDRSYGGREGREWLVVAERNSEVVAPASSTE